MIKKFFDRAYLASCFGMLAGTVGLVASNGLGHLKLTLSFGAILFISLAAGMALLLINLAPEPEEDEKLPEPDQGYGDVRIWDLRQKP